MISPCPYSTPLAPTLPPSPAASPSLPAHISPTAAKSYLGCSLRFWFERVLRLPRPAAPALHLGKAVHAALQAFHLARWRGTDDSPETITAHYEAAFLRLEREQGPVDYAHPDDREKHRLDGLRMIAAYLDSPEPPVEKPRAVEVFLTETIAGLSVPLHGAMDLVESDFKPVDFKSAAARPVPEHALFEHEIQLVSYQLLLEAATGHSPPALDLVYIVKTKTPQVLRISAPPATRVRKTRVIALLERAVQGIAAGRFHPQPGMQCAWCRFRAECSQWPGPIRTPSRRPNHPAP